MSSEKKNWLLFVRWYTNLPNWLILVSQVVLSVAIGLFFLMSQFYVVALGLNLFFQLLMAAVVGLIVFLKPLRRILELYRERIALESRYKELKRANVVDSLTGAYNRNFLKKARQIVTTHAIRNRCFVVCVIIDVDRMKQINDTHGHFAGDLALKAVVKKIRGFFRESDFIIRYGGDEFVVLCYTNMPDELLSKVNGNFESLKIDFVDNNDCQQSFVANFSCGFACLDAAEVLTPGMITDELIEKIHVSLFKKADCKLYEAKNLKEIRR